MDYMASHDFEDIISVLDGRKEIVDEIKNVDENLKNYLRSAFADIVQSRSFNDTLLGHFNPYGNLAEYRRELLLNRIEQIVK